MHRSIRWHLLLNSLAVSLVAIIAVGTVTLLLVENYFDQQEEVYLRERGEELIPTFESALTWRAPSDMQELASFGLFASRVRIRLLDRDGQLLADSGSFEGMNADDILSKEPGSLTSFEFYVDDLGRFHGFGLSQEERALYPGIKPDRPFWSETRQPQKPIAPAPQPPATDISEAEILIPLRVDNQVVGYAQLSEGPAFGQIIEDSIRRALLVGGLVALLAAVLAAIVSARQVTKPLLALGRKAEEMAEGNLDSRAEASKISEIDRLARQFNGMADRLTATITALEADRNALRRFIADASHELRTPLTALTTFNELMTQDPTLNIEPATTFIGESGKQLAQLDRLTGDLLDLGRLEARLSGTEFEIGDIRPVLERSCQDLRPMSQSKQQRLELIMPQEEVILAHDPLSLARTIGNLGTNAVKYTPTGGRIQVALKEVDKKYVTINVRDNGNGIPADEQPLDFNRFFRGQGITDSGSGLGLSIAQEIAAIHNGNITFISRDEEGSLFTLELPISGRDIDRYTL